MMETENDLRRAVQDYIHAAASHARRSGQNVGETHSILETLEYAKLRAVDIVTQEVALYLREVNERSSICRLPEELLAEVYCHLGVSDRFAASQVCHLWRIAGTHYPRVWTGLESFGPLSPRLPLALQRSRSLPVKLGLTVSESRSNWRFLADIRRHLHHLSALNVTLETVFITLSTLLDMLTKPAPLLVELSLAAFFHAADRRPEQFLRNDLFSGCAPKLSRLVLRNILLPSAPIPALSGVVFLRLTSATENGSAYLTAHVGLPNLAEYELLVPPSLYPSAIQPVIAPAPRLRVVRLLGPSTTPVLTLRPFANCPRFSLAQSSWHMIARLWRDCNPPTREVVLQCGRGAFVGGVNEQGVSRMFKDVKDHPHATAVLAPVAPHLRALVIDTGSRVNRAIPAITFPKLTYLHVLMSTLDVPTWEQGERFHPLLPMWIRAPALRVFRLSVLDPAAQISSNTVGVISDFVARLEPLGPVFLERDGIPLANVPDRFVPRPISAPLEHFLVEKLVQYRNWDDWLANALDQIPDA